MTIRQIPILLFLWLLPKCIWSQKVEFSRTGGFYEESFCLTLSCDEAYHIRYTTNGTTPTAESALYSQPLVIDTNLYSKSDIYTIVNCIPERFRKFDNVDRCIIIRAAAFDKNDVCVSEVETNTYFIKSLGCDFHGLPVFSIAADSLDLFDYETGIFVPGKYYDDKKPRNSGNYYQRGRDWEREINLEFYDTDNSGINQNCGLRTHGNASRWFQQKGMKLYARQEYGKKRFVHQFFKDSQCKRFKHLTLHPFACSVWLQTGGQEYISHQIDKGLDIDATPFREVTVFINGEYWGIYTLEETPDEHFLENHYDVDINNVNIIKYFEVNDYGDISDWQKLFEWFKTADLNKPADSAYAYSRFDVPSLIDYMIFEIFSANLDWPRNNVRIWQSETGQPFRFIFFDGDGCFIRWGYDALANAMNCDFDSMILNSFLKQYHFRKAFYNRYLELKATSLSQETMMSALKKYRNTVKDEIPRQSKRFGFPKSMKSWKRDLDSISDFIKNRHDAFEEEFFNTFKIDDKDIRFFTCYPNPKSNIINVCLNSSASNMAEISIYNCFDKKVFSEKYFVGKGSNSIKIDIDFPKGVYYVKTNNLSQQIIIQ